MMFYLGQLIIVDNYSKGIVPAILIGKRYVANSSFTSYWALFLNKEKELVIDYFNSNQIDYVHKAYNSDPAATGGECIHFGKFATNVKSPLFSKDDQNAFEELSTKERKVTKKDVVNYLTYIEQRIKK